MAFSNESETHHGGWKLKPIIKAIVTLVSNLVRNTVLLPPHDCITRNQMHILRPKMIIMKSFNTDKRYQKKRHNA